MAEFLCMVEGFWCHSNHSSKLFDLKKKKKNKKTKQKTTTKKNNNNKKKQQASISKNKLGLAYWLVAKKMGGCQKKPWKGSFDTQHFHTHWFIGPT